MHPLAFDEFLLFKGENPLVIKKYKQIPFNAAWYNKQRELYKEFLKYGGFPEVVLQKKVSDKKELLWDIINSYIDMDVKLLSDYSLNKDLFNLVKLLSARVVIKALWYINLKSHFL